MQELFKDHLSPAAPTSAKTEQGATEVVILGGRYTVKSGYSAAFVERTAALVNEKLSEIIRDGGIIATDKVAILACMNMASELLKLQEEHRNLKDRMRRRLEKVLTTLSTTLNQEEIGYVTDKSSADKSQKRSEAKEEFLEIQSSLPCA